MHRFVRGLSDAALTLGTVMVLFAVHLLWWTNHAARAQAQDEVQRLEQQWSHPEPAAPGPAGKPYEAGPGGEGQPRRAGDRAGNRAGDVPSPGAPADVTGQRAPARSRSFAILRIPRLNLTVPVAEGVDKHRVLDRGFVGHYPGAALPGQIGNVALAAHRNTHGEPFRHLDRVRPGDTVTLTTADGDFRYRVDSVLPRTSPDDSDTIQPVPTTAYGDGRTKAGGTKKAGYDRPGRYITLTTCTPEYTSRYRLVVWGRLLES
ncbi:class E sortase [Streptomyces scopuliridis]|uniref:Class E sortase n=1 Tax=Streptomyces scopuliridis TaxID=452529 RepID=A0ACD4ZF42_9ACTN|nr:class E sortase [Streptomyces scopuliridis]WSB32538.1 class E sortase [Streptomyces scopuliridis]WSB96784.1 class E sortase [Streptomyces scopuliridis]WSC09512.1 class E sortase [Streptomyces scopuliridis]